MLSVYGVQFSPNQEKAANEMLRVWRAGGTIGLASDTDPGLDGRSTAQLGYAADGLRPRLTPSLGVFQWHARKASRK